MALSDHLEKLKNLVAVAKYQSINKAGQRIGLSQPSLSTSLRLLEEDLGCKLFTRTSKGVIPTEDGKTLVEFANRILMLSSEVEAQIRHTKRDLDVHLRIGTHESISVYFFPDFIRYLNSAFPKLRLSLKTGRSRAAIDWLKSGDIDVAISVEPPSGKKIISQSLFYDHFNFFMMPNSENWQASPLILMPDALEMTGKTLRTQIADYAKKHDRILECENHETVRALSEEGLGIGLLPDQVAKNSVSRNRLVRVTGKVLPANIVRHSIGYSFLSHRKDDLALQDFLKELVRFSSVWVGQGK
ncbi:MAG: LysR family transcriptional regulator [Bdellovibrionales bacterium]|nr:LysR family transcriptional regulator [Bdellovibrionales bacterium]